MLNPHSLSCSLLILVACDPGHLTRAEEDRPMVELVDGGAPTDMPMGDAPAADNGPRFDMGPIPDAASHDTRPPEMDAFVPMIDAGTDVPTPADPLAAVRIVDVDGFQTVEVPMVRDGSPQTGSVIVAGRALWVRVTVAPEAGFSGEVEAILTLEGSGEEIEIIDRRYVDRAIGALPAEAFAFEVPGSWVRSNVSYSIAMYATTGTGGGPTDGATFPLTGSQELAARDMPAVEVRFVPVRYNADGSGRLPTLDAATMARLQEHFEALLPTADVRLSVTEPLGPK